MDRPLDPQSQLAEFFYWSTAEIMLNTWSDSQQLSNPYPVVVAHILYVIQWLQANLSWDRMVVVIVGREN